MATTRPLVVITTAAPELASWSPLLRAFAIAPARIFWTCACSGALMLVTRSSPALAGVWLTVPVTTPSALTATFCTPGVPRSWASYCCSSPAWPTRSTPEKPVTARCRCLISFAVMGCR